MSTQVLRFSDKDKRDEVFEELRHHGDECERQAVKSSDVEDGKSVWYISYPMSPPNTDNPKSRKERHLRRLIGEPATIPQVCEHEHIPHESVPEEAV